MSITARATRNCEAPLNRRRTATEAVPGGSSHRSREIRAVEKSEQGSLLKRNLLLLASYLAVLLLIAGAYR